MMRSDDELPQIVDRMDDFRHFFEQTRDTSPDERIQIFKRRIIEPNLSFYSHVSGINSDVLKQYVTEAETRIEALDTSQGEILDRFNNILKSFRLAFPRLQTNFVTVLLPSLNLFKGMAVPSRGKIFLLLGIDALIGLNDNEYRGYITHELFHVYHFQHSPAVRDATEAALRTMKMPALWGLLWTEGLACYAVRLVYPEIPEEEIFNWRTLVEETKPLLPDLAREARRILVSDSPEAVAGYFYIPRRNGLYIPTGCGYYLGMLIAADLIRKYPLEELFLLKNDELIDEIDSALEALPGSANLWCPRRII